MSKHLSLVLLGTSCMYLTSLHAQNWVNGGNTLAADGRLGTNNAFALILETNNTERGRITNSGIWAIGTTPKTAKFTVNSAAGQHSFRAMVGESTKLIVNSNGGTTIGGGTTVGPANGLYVAGRVGIGTATPGYALDILNPSIDKGINVYNNYTGNADRIGVSVYSVTNPGYGYGIQAYGGFHGIDGTASGGSYTGAAIGVYGQSSGSTGNRYGVYGYANGSGTGNRYGVYGYAIEGSFRAAGYFNGDVYAVNYLKISDRKFKEGIAPLEPSLQQLMKLRPAAYQFKTGEFKGMHLPQGKQIGLIADEVKEIFPELVQQAVHPAKYDKDTRKVLSPEINYESVNYEGLIPVLIASVQELKSQNDEQQQLIEQQQLQMNDLKSELTDLKLLVSKLTGGQNNNTFLSNARLGEVTPNPVKGTAIIQYTIPEGSYRPQLLITDALGRQIKALQLSASGTVNIDVSTLASGVYNYSLIVNNKTIATRKMNVIH
jgi:hypothetical protein